MPGVAELLTITIGWDPNIAKFWGLAGQPRVAAAKERKKARKAAPIASGRHVIAAKAKGEKKPAGGERASVLRSLPVDIGAVITNALKAAGLMEAD